MKKTPRRSSLWVTWRTSPVRFTSLPATGGTLRKSRILKKKEEVWISWMRFRREKFTLNLNVNATWTPSRWRLPYLRLLASLHRFISTDSYQRLYPTDSLHAVWFRWLCWHTLTHTHYWELIPPRGPCCSLVLLTVIKQQSVCASEWPCGRGTSCLFGFEDSKRAFWKTNRYLEYEQIGSRIIIIVIVWVVDVAPPSVSPWAEAMTCHCV